jgi:ATP-dependent DNA ligase
LIVKRWQNHTLDTGKAGLNKTVSFSTAIEVGTPIKPMLARKVSSLAECYARSPKGLFSEIKYDGERIQIHKSGQEFKCYSRNLKPVQPWKVKTRSFFRFIFIVINFVFLFIF